MDKSQVKHQSEWMDRQKQETRERRPSRSVWEREHCTGQQAGGAKSNKTSIRDTQYDPGTSNGLSRMRSLHGCWVTAGDGAGHSCGGRIIDTCARTYT